jgi:hypothetical protein
MRQHKTNRLNASAIVNGSQRVPSVARNQPLKTYRRMLLHLAWWIEVGAAIRAAAQSRDLRES